MPAGETVPHDTRPRKSCHRPALVPDFFEGVARVQIAAICGQSSAGGVGMECRRSPGWYALGSFMARPRLFRFNVFQPRHKSGSPAVWFLPSAVQFRNKGG